MYQKYYSATPLFRNVVKYFRFQTWQRKYWFWKIKWWSIWKVLLEDFQGVLNKLCYNSCEVKALLAKRLFNMLEGRIFWIHFHVYLNREPLCVLYILHEHVPIRFVFHSIQKRYNRLRRFSVLVFLYWQNFE